MIYFDATAWHMAPAGVPVAKALDSIRTLSPAGTVCLTIECPKTLLVLPTAIATVKSMLWADRLWS